MLGMECQCTIGDFFDGTQPPQRSAEATEKARAKATADFEKALRRLEEEQASAPTVPPKPKSE